MTVDTWLHGALVSRMRVRSRAHHRRENRTLSVSWQRSLCRQPRQGTGHLALGPGCDCNHAVGEQNYLWNETSLQDHCADLLLELVVSSPTCLWWKRGPVGHFFGQVPQRSGQLSIGKLTRQNLRQYTVNTNLRPNGHTRAYSPGKQNWFSNRGPLPKPTTKTQTTSNRLTQSLPFHV